MVNNKTLHSKFKKLIASALYTYERDLVIDPRFANDKYYIPISLSKLDEKIKKIPEFNECVIAMEKDKKMKKLNGKLVGTNKMLSQVNNEECVMNLIKKIYFKNPTYSENIFEQEYSNFEEFFHSKKLRIKDSVTLYNFKSDKNEIDLGDGIIIKRVQPPKNIEIRQMGYPSISKSQFILERNYEEKKVVGKSGLKQNEAEITSSEIFDLVIASLRILKSSGLYRDHKIQSEIMTFYPHGGITTTSPFYENLVVGKECTLKEPDMLKLKNIFKFIISEKDNRFKIAERRLRMGMERKIKEDKLIDYMIGFEALYLPSIKQELSFRLSLRCAFILSSNQKQKEAMYKFIKNMYTVRSNMVHGEKYKLSDEDVIKIEVLLRASLKLWMKNKATFTQTNLDKLFFK